MERVGIIGHFGGKEAFFDGQTVKTKNLESMLSKNSYSIYRVDTYYFRHNPIKLVLKTIKCLFTCKKIFMLLSENGMRVFLPFIHFANKIFRRKIYHDIIGSELLGIVDQKPKFVKYLNSLAINWFEYQSGTDKLRAKGVKNAETLPNCKELVGVSSSEIEDYSSGDVKQFCTFSRVMEEKGISDAINAVAKLNQERGQVVAKLDIYGPIEPIYEEPFEKLLQENSDYISYCGITNSEESVEVLKRYYALVFPTKWHGEGFPGTILDALASGLPIIASDWNANKELVKSEKTGIIYPSKKHSDLYAALKWAVDNDEEMKKMRFACREDYENYTPTTIINKIKSELDKQ